MRDKTPVKLPCGALGRVVDHRRPFIVNGYSPHAADYTAQAAQDTVVFVLWNEDSPCTCGQHTGWRGKLFQASDPILAGITLPKTVS